MSGQVFFKKSSPDCGAILTFVNVKLTLASNFSTKTPTCFNTEVSCSDEVFTS